MGTSNSGAGVGRTNGRATPRMGAPRRAAAPRAVTPADLPGHAGEVLSRLLAAYPDARCALDHQTPLQLLAATILSAQCTDKRVNMVTPTLFAAYPTAAALAEAPLEAVEEIIKSTGFFRNKAKSLVGMARALVERHAGDVPAEMAALVALPGVGRKTANVVLGNAFGRDEGIVVDTHVGRLSRRLGLTAESDPEKVEAALMPLFPRDRWTMLAHLLIEHGRRVCDARVPRCGECMLRDRCPSALVA
ncbi:MAG TPA: endonuclease III [Gemmatimonadaceae bacterium]|nr:endonuclease III [Gemmatimonadaceae bacterium]